MASDEQILVDWANLPGGVPTLSLWDSLHDGDLLEIHSDLLARRVTLRFDVGHIRDFHKLPEDTRLIAVITGVQSVRAVRNVPWPGQFSVPEGSTREQESMLIAEYQAKWREESLSWEKFEQLTSDGLEVSNAILARGSASVALRLGVMAADRWYLEAFLRGDGITFYAGEHQLTPEEFVAMGEAYWEAFAKRKSR